MMGFTGFGELGGLGMGLGMLVWIVVIGLAIWALIAVFDNRATRSGGSAVEILKQRYARGELSKAEFEQAKQDIY